MIDENYLVKLIDYGEKKIVEHENIFRPLQKYINLEVQAFKIRLDGEYNHMQQENTVSN